MVHQTMSTRMSRAATASNTNNHMSFFDSLPSLRRGLLPACAAILGVLAGCADAPRSSPAPLEDRTPGAAPPASASAPPGSAGPLLRPRSRWVAVDWADLPGWQNDRLRDWWPALQRGCVKPAPGWAAACADALGRGALNDEAARAWVQQWLRPYRVESLEGVADGLITGYLEASVEATRTPQATMRVPVHAVGILLPVAFWGVARELGLSRWAAFGVGALAVLDNAWLVMTRIALTDVFFILFGFAALWAYLRHRRGGRARGLWVAAVLAGAAISVK